MAIPYSPPPPRMGLQGRRDPSAMFFDTENIPTQRLDIIQEIAEQVRVESYSAMAQAGLDPITRPVGDDALALKWDLMTSRRAVDTEQAIHKTCLDGAFGQLAVISYAADDEDPVNLWDSNWSAPGYEPWLLNELDVHVRRRFGKAFQLVGHNIAFDRNMVRQRALVLGCPAHRIFTAEVKPWENAVVYDTMTGWTGDVRTRITQDKLCKALGIAGKGSDLEDGEYIDGSQVWDFIRRGEIAKVATYCGGDVVRARRIFRALMGMDPRPPYPAFTPTPAPVREVVGGLPAQAPMCGGYFDVEGLEP